MKTLYIFLFSVLFFGKAIGQTTPAARDTILLRGSIEKNCPGGFAVFNDYIKSVTRPPAVMVERKKEGCVRVAFIIEPDSTVSNIHATTKLGYQMEEEAMRSIKMSSGWIPSTIDGKNVRTSMEEVGVQYNRLAKNMISIEGKIVD